MFEGRSRLALYYYLLCRPLLSLAGHFDNRPGRLYSFIARKAA